MSDAPSRLFPGTVFISTILEALDAKTSMVGEIAHRYVQRAAMAGIVIGTFYVTNYAVVAAFDEVPAGAATLAPLGRFTGALVFGWALVFIYYTKSELLTSNMMITAIGVYHRRIKVLRALRLMGLCFLGNALGGLVIALLLRLSTLVDGDVGEHMRHATDVKLAFVTSGAAGMGDLLVRAIFCNFMINLAMLVVYNGFVKDDLTKALVMVMSVFVFAFDGFEHSVANTVLFTVVGLQGGIDVVAAIGNVAVALVGNFLGGGVLIGVYYAYINDHSRALKGRAG